MASVEERVQQIIGRSNSRDMAEVTPTASFVRIWGSDSLDHVECHGVFEEAFAECPYEYAEKMTTVKDGRRIFANTTK